MFATERRLHTRKDVLLFAAKAALFRLDRMRRDLAQGEVRRFPVGAALAEAPVIAESRTRLWSEAIDAEQVLLAGKIQNLRVALRRVNGVEVPAGRVFGFWAHVGRPIRQRGFVAGRELREGCVVPSVGGGLCQLSNALYDAALRAGFEIVERHAHSQVIPGSLAEIGRDATVFWNYVDLRFRADRSFRIEADMDAEHLVVRFRADGAAGAERPPETAALMAGKGPNNCLSCNVVRCFRHVPAATQRTGETAFLLDGFVPEFDRYIQSIRRDSDSLYIPLDGRRMGKPRYAWSTEGFGGVRSAAIATLWRAWRSRRLADQGAARQRALLAGAERLAESYGRRLRPEATHLVVAQNLLPFLWRRGDLAGRSFDVLMTALPMGMLQERLDHAARRHPESRTLGDFRADPDLVKAEAAALERAHRIVTPHADIAALFPTKAVRLDWIIPDTGPATVPSPMAGPGAKPRLVLPAATLARKGAYTLREALRGLDVTLVVAGRDHEGAGFWQSFDVVRATAAEALVGADTVVLPALVEHAPRALLRAKSLGIPVIASRECGVPPGPGIVTIAAGDVRALRAAILALLRGGRGEFARAA